MCIRPQVADTGVDILGEHEHQEYHEDTDCRSTHHGGFPPILEIKKEAQTEPVKLKSVPLVCRVS